MKVEQNSIVDLLAEPLKYQRHLELYGLMGESYRNLYISLMSFRPKAIKEPNLEFLHQELGLFHVNFHEFLGDISFLREQFSIQVVFLKDHPYLVNANMFMDFSEIEEEIDNAYKKSILFHERIQRHIDVEISALDLVVKDYEKYLFFPLGEKLAGCYAEVLSKNFKNALYFSVYGILYNFYLPLMELLRHGYYYLGYGWSRDYRPCYYIGICK